ncbi:GGDEF domain-containing protein [Nakamurella antarctica]|uniref:GGDEF domain-containing protein n=1 Tax=Nakamurella antarctica TaxID=1902245 RepID=A0A3G8ZY17_9ACTN|nr:GGDEF domain-containing protein [Nakamurella antarctica]AZI58541.1 GGDEF domain-containing protein [Nakamurella antarctica]
MARGTQLGRMSARALRTKWAEESALAGWSFPSDWDSPAVDAICEAAVGETDIWPAAERLGRARAAAGVGLGETLADVDALTALVSSRYADQLRRGVSLGWAERITAPPVGISDPLTGLVSKEYLQLRLAEIYQQAQAQHFDVNERFALAVVRVDLSGRSAWQRTLPMILVSECLRSVFDAGETLARLGEPIAVALAHRDEMLPRRLQLAARMYTSRISADPQANIPAPRVWTEPLPTKFASVRFLLDELAR